MLRILAALFAALLWLAVSDVHLDPFAGAKHPSTYGADTNPALLDSALGEMKRVAPDPAVVVLPGDFFVHQFASVVGRHPAAGSPDDVGIATMRAVARRFGQAFPHAQFVLAIGNNDVPCGDYRSAAGSAYLAAMAHAWAPLVNRAGTAPSFEASFARRGYYAAVLSKRLRLIALDTVVLSHQYAGACGGNAAGAATQELAWLNATLHAAPPGVRTIVAMHVPPGFDAFATELARGFLAWPYLQPGSDEGLIAALAAPDNRVAFALAGHAHRFDFRLAGRVPIVVLGSVSPIYHNNPAFYTLRVGDDGALEDIDTYAFDERAQAWNGPYDFDTLWSVDRIDAATLMRVHARLETDWALRDRWDLASSGFLSQPADLRGTWRNWWRVAWCAQTVLARGFAQCAGIEQRAAAVRWLAPAIAVLALTALVWLIARRRRVREAST